MSREGQHNLKFLSSIKHSMLSSQCVHNVIIPLYRRWKIPGAQAVLDLRCVWENGEMDEFMNNRIRREHKRLYSRPINEGLAA
jgi:hypothetical protein